MTTRDNAPAPPRLLLVGGGHAHLEVLRRLAHDAHPVVRLTLLSVSDRHHYSGMVPGYLAGQYRESELAFDLATLAARAGGELVVGTAVALDPGGRRVGLADGRRLAYDLVSFNVGSTTAGAENVPGVAEHAVTVKPLSRALLLRARLDELVVAGAAGGSDPARRRGPRVVVVGAGAGGVEVAFAAAARLREVGGEVTLVEAGREILPGASRRLRRLARRRLLARKIVVSTGAPVRRVRAHEVVLAGSPGELPLRSDLTIWLTGPAASPLFRGSGLPLEARGFLLVDAALRSLADRRVFAAGDCATLADHPATPKAGVYAVREAPVLWRSLLATLAGDDPAERGIAYHPQPGFLSLLNTGDGEALLAWKGLAAGGAWAWWLKDRIDRRFVRRYQPDAG